MTRKLRLALWLLALQLALACPGTATGAVEETNGCAANLRNIHIAIQSYRQQHQELPNRLSDLVPDHLTDVRALACPVAEALGTSSYKAANWKEVEIFDPRTTYLYEFGTNRIPDTIQGGSGQTMRPWKRAQMGLVGGRIPMVRCLVHPMVLNLGFDGEIYPSQLQWENVFRDVVRTDDLTPTWLLAGGVPVRVVRVPPRDPKAPVWLIDLGEFYNASLSSKWCSDDPHSHFGSLPTGVQTFGGTAFDVRGLIQLRCDKYLSVLYPPAVTNIPIGLRCQRLHFLHASAWSPTRRASTFTNGFYVVHYDGGRAAELPIVYGTHLIEWVANPAREFKKPKDSSVAWEGQYKDSSGKNQKIYLYHTTWINPSPETLIRSLDFKSAAQNGNLTASSAPFLVAVSADP